jgi:transposase
MGRAVELSHRAHFQREELDFPTFSPPKQVRQFLCPTLRPGDIIILDNLSSHKVAGVKQAIAAAGATLIYLPPYSPDLNPIEKLFAKLKALLRKAAKRSVDALCNEIGELLNTLSSTECANYFASSGYVYT